MRNDGWVAGVAALVVLSGLTGALLALAVRPAPLEPPEPAAGPPLTVARPPRPMLCVGAGLVCAAPQLPAGYPCSCAHPLRGTISGRVASVDDADEVLSNLPGGNRRLDLDDLRGP